MAKTDLIQTIKKHQLKEFNTYNLNFQLSSHLQMMQVPKDKIIFKIGDPVVNFYFIFKGNVSVLKPISQKIFLSYKEYFFHLVKLSKDEENFLLLQTIILNKEVLSLNAKEDLLDMQIAFLKFNVEKDKIIELFSERNFDIWDIKNFFKGYGLNCEDLNIEEAVLENLIENRNKVIKEELNIINTKSKNTLSKININNIYKSNLDLSSPTNKKAAPQTKN